MTDTGLHLSCGTSVPALADGLIARLASLRTDPFAAPLVLVPGAGMRRWLSQRIARSAPGGEGICAGIDFAPLARLEELLTGAEPADDPWAPERLVWEILALAEAGTPGLEPLTHHLQATEQRLANAARVARLLDRYVRLCPDLLRSWSQAPVGDDLGLGFDRWQAVLWQALRARLPGADPVERQLLLLDEAAQGRVRLDAPALEVFCPRRLRASEVDLLAALARQTRVEVSLAVTGPVESTHPLSRRLGRQSRDDESLLRAVATEVRQQPAPPSPRTLLGALQHDLGAGIAPRPREFPGSDRTLDVHASHGPSRQVEVLREVLTGLFADDHTLEPRDVVVACPDPAALAPHLAAAFADDPRPDAHPGHTFRLQVAGGTIRDNQLYALVREVTLLGRSRATLSQLLGLVTHPFVARRFGFTGEDAERLGELIPAAAVRWGVNDAHRRLFGLGEIRQGTWQIGVQRLLLGEALRGEELASVGVISPVDEVDSSDVELLGGLAELVSRLSRFLRLPAQDTASAWVERWRAIVEQVADIPFEDSWQQAQLWAALATVSRQSAGSTAQIGASEALTLLDAEMVSRGRRPSFGNGSLVVCSLTDLAQVPHRVVCLVGLDEREFPRRHIADGDDLCAGDQFPGAADPGREDRQAILDAIGAAAERLIVIYRGFSSHLQQRRPAPAGVVDLLEAAALTRGRAESDADEWVIPEPLQPFSPVNFTQPPRSFDTVALRGADALMHSVKEPVPTRYATRPLPPAPPPAALGLDQVRSFLLHPAQYLLKERAGLTLRTDHPADEALPLELDSLARWQIGQRVLDGLLRGQEPAAVQHAEWLRGELPPGRLGQRILDEVTAVALRTAQQHTRLALAPPESDAIDLDLGGVRLTGRVLARENVLLVTGFSRPSARQFAGAWLDGLALSVQRGRPITAELLGRGKRATLRIPEPDEARALLLTLTGLAVEGLSRLLPMPPRTAYCWAQNRARNADPLADRGLGTQWSWDSDDTWSAVLDPSEKPWDARVTDEAWAPPGERTLLGALAAVVWAPILRAEA